MKAEESINGIRK